MRKLLIILALLFAHILLAPVLSFGVACPAGYTLTATLRILPQTILSADVANFPVYFPGHASFATVANGGSAQSSTGLDIVWCDAASSGNVLPYELVVGTYSPTTGAGEWWIKASVSKTKVTTIYAMVGTGSPTDKSCGPSGTNNCGTTLWNGYALVAHFGTSGTLTLTDSTATNTLTNHSATAAAAQINGGANFVAASTQYIDVGATNNFTTGTVIQWVKPGTFQSCGATITNFASPTFNGFFMGIGWTTGSGGSCAANGGIVCEGGNAGAVFNNNGSTAVISAGQWSLISCNFSPAAVPQPMVNGVAATYTGSTGTLGTTSANVNIGRYSGAASNYFDGEEDEVRIYSGALLSADYQRAMYINQALPATFYSFIYRSPQHFYVSAAGSDSNNGTSSGTPWQTITKVNSYAVTPGFIAGDEISFRNGDSFAGPMAITGLAGDSVGGNIVIDSY